MTPSGGRPFGLFISRRRNGIAVPSFDLSEVEAIIPMRRSTDLIRAAHGTHQALGILGQCQHRRLALRGEDPHHDLAVDHLNHSLHGKELAAHGGALATVLPGGDGVPRRV